MTAGHGEKALGVCVLAAVCMNRRCACRYNLKRKIADMPPVTREWFEARKETLAASTGAPVSKFWTDPLTKKRFNSENTYKAYVNSNKYKELVKQSGKPAPQPTVTLRRAVSAGAFPNA